MASKKPHKPGKRYPEDFDFGNELGIGSFGSVILATEIATNKKFAIKVIQKNLIVKEDKRKYVFTERDILNKCKHEGIIKLCYTFQDPTSLYFVMELAEKGELLDLIKKYGSLDIPSVKFIAAQLVEILDYLRSIKIIHRDLKPENILFSDSGHLKLTDFGTAKDLEKNVSSDNSNSNSRRNRQSFVGTAEYVSPEILHSEESTYASDIWALGCIIYQMITGKPPFQASSQYQVFQKVIEAEITFPEEFPQDAKDLVQKLIKNDPSERLGANKGMKEIKSHPFFKGISFDSLWQDTPPEHGPFPPIKKRQEREKSKSASAIKEIPYTKKNKTHKESTKMFDYSQFLKDGEEIIFQSTCIKRKGISKKRRQFILTSRPRLFYVDPESMVVKGEVPLNMNSVSLYKNNRQFTIEVPDRIYHLEDLTSQAPKWTKAINDAVLKL